MRPSQILARFVILSEAKDPCSQAIASDLECPVILSEAKDLTKLVALIDGVRGRLYFRPGLVSTPSAKRL